jgi:hypothetical protein
MPVMPKLAPEVELPRPRSSGVAVVAVAALAMFTAVGASAFIIRVRMGMAASAASSSSSSGGTSGRVSAAVAMRRSLEPPVGRIGPRFDLVANFEAAAADHDDRAALELYQQIPVGMDPTGRLRRIRAAVVDRQVLLLQAELSRGDCDELRRHVAWLRQATKEELSVHVGECRAASTQHIISVELAP